MTFFKNVSIAIVAMLFMTSAIFAQGQQPPQMPELPTSSDVSDEEINLLVKTMFELEPIQIETQDKMAEAVEAEDISFERFQILIQAMQNPQMADEVDVSDEEMSKLQALQPKLMEIQGEAQQEMVAAIEANGLTTQRYQSILMGAQQDPELRLRLEELIEEEEEG